jgi:hypothetical protein
MAMRRRRELARAGLALLLLVVGAEVFFRFASVPSLKVVALLLVTAGLLFLGWPGEHPSALQFKLLAAIAFVGFIAQAAHRYPGLLKELPPPAASEVAAFCARIAGLLLGAAVAVNFSVRGLRRLAARQGGLRP